ncbi:MAG: hypothetical protein K2Y12_13325 [Chitinophagaceae bacterium]|jgi:hypothetical protein|nr:hypothetical protein [Chitinophagales bacterium]MBX9893299.1 hypothetical protein [Chitinophagaceae bacterium]
MEAQQQSRTKYWVYCFIWTAIMLYMLWDPTFRPFFWLALPGATTYFALGMDLI